MNLNEILTDTCARSGLTTDEMLDKKHPHAIYRFCYCRRAIDIFGNKITLAKIGEVIGYNHSEVIRAWRGTYQIRRIRNKYAELWPSNK
jgi:hypothetical protein